MIEKYTLIVISAIQILFLPAIIFFGKRLVEFFFNKTIELKKAELAQNLENYKKEIEQENKNFQYQLDSKLQEFNIKFSSLHTERAEVIKNLYFKLIDLQSAMFNFTRLGHIVIEDSQKEEKERLDRVNDTLKNFTDYYHPNKIFFSSSITLKIDNLFKEYWETGWKFAKVLRENNYNQTIESEINNWQNISDKVDTFFPPLIMELENDFREILGVKN